MGGILTVTKNNWKLARVQRLEAGPNILISYPLNTLDTSIASHEQLKSVRQESFCTKSIARSQHLLAKKYSMNKDTASSFKHPLRLNSASFLWQQATLPVSSHIWDDRPCIWLHTNTKLDNEKYQKTFSTRLEEDDTHGEHLELRHGKHLNTSIWLLLDRRYTEAVI